MWDKASVQDIPIGTDSLLSLNRLRGKIDNMKQVYSRVCPKYYLFQLKEQKGTRLQDAIKNGRILKEIIFYNFSNVILHQTNLTSLACSTPNLAILLFSQQLWQPW